MFTSNQFVRARVDAQKLVEVLTEGIVYRRSSITVGEVWTRDCDADVLRSLTGLADELGFDLVQRHDHAAQAHVENSRAA